MAELRINQIQRVSRTNLEDQPITFGRSSECEMILSHNSVSREHCIIERRDGVPMIRDLDSTRGTKVNGHKITEQAIYDGDVIRIGIYEVIFEDPQNKRPELDDLGSEPEIEVLARNTVESSPPSEPAPGSDPAKQNELEQLITQLKEQLVSRDQHITGFDIKLDEAREEALKNLKHATKLETELAVKEKTNLELEGQLSEATNQQEALKTRFDQSLQELQKTSQTLAEAQDRIGTLTEEIKGLKNSNHDMSRQMGEIERVLGELKAEAQTLFASSKQLSTIQQGLQALEHMYVETNEWAELADQTDPEAYEQAMAQQETVGQKLEAIHLQRDEASEQLQQLVERFCRLIISEEAFTIPEGSQKRSLLSRITGN